MSVVLGKVMEVGLKSENPHFNKAIDKAIISTITKKNSIFSKEVNDQKYYMVRALINSIRNILLDQNISKNCKKRITSSLLGNVALKPALGIELKKRIKNLFIKNSSSDDIGPEKLGYVLIDPTGNCNLRCFGCYAAAGGPYSKYKLTLDEIKRVIKEGEVEFGTYFNVVTGGEPFLHENLMDMFASFPDHYFMVYTNATLIDKEKARQLAKLGNVIPAISVEGKEEDTIKRRGKWATKKIMEAFKALKEAGVPYLLSITATKHNVHRFSDRSFIIDYCFGDLNSGGLGCNGIWVFQYQPVGFDPDLSLLVTPEQRVEMYNKIKEYVREGYFIADFWASGAVTARESSPGGCIAAARGGGGGQIVIKADGTVLPCVFFPLKDAKMGNIKEIWARGGTLADAANSDLFVEIRKSQRKRTCYQLPCTFKDQFYFPCELLKKGIGETTSYDQGTKQVLTDKKTVATMKKYNKECKEAFGIKEST
jgi:radical SAM protein with 4Fe4S-binding SPASM domain